VNRQADIFVATLLALLAVPIWVVAAVLVRIRLGRPVLFKQERQGHRGTTFRIFKLRTMTDARDEGGALLSDAERLPRIGRVLRNLSIDELPQLLNVIRGEMAIVGPRPLLPRYIPLYTSDQARRMDVLPGITSWAQVNGRNALDWERKLELDVWYVDHRSWWLDLRILLRTVWVVLAGTGVTHKGHATMPEFRGSP